MIVIGKGNNFLESLEQFGGLGLSNRSFSTCSSYSITNSVKGAVFQSFRKGEQGTIKNGKWQLLKMTGPCFIVILIK